MSDCCFFFEGLKQEAKPKNKTITEIHIIEVWNEYLYFRTQIILIKNIGLIVAFHALCVVYGLYAFVGVFAVCVINLLFAPQFYLHKLHKARAVLSLKL